MTLCEILLAKGQRKICLNSPTYTATMVYYSLIQHNVYKIFITFCCYRKQVSGCNYIGAFSYFN